MYPIKFSWKSLKIYGRWFIIVGTAVFLAQAFHQHWQEIVAIPITPTQWGIIGIATGVTLGAHCWAAWVWTRILDSFNCRMPRFWVIRIYLKTNLSKYWPGNVGHFLGRVLALQKAQVPRSTAVLSVLMEPLLVVFAALILAIILSGPKALPIAIIGLLLTTVILHPQILNRALRLLKKGFTAHNYLPPQLLNYPWIPGVGAIIFILGRSLGFIMIALALTPNALTNADLVKLLWGFCFSYCLGVVIPGAPGGLGVFESTLLILLRPHFTSVFLLSLATVYRFMSMLAEILGAFVAYLLSPTRWNQSSS